MEKTFFQRKELTLGGRVLSGALSYNTVQLSSIVATLVYYSPVSNLMVVSGDKFFILLYLFNNLFLLYTEITTIYEHDLIF